MGSIRQAGGLGPRLVGLVLGILLAAGMGIDSTARADVDAARQHWRTLQGQDAALLAPKHCRDTESVMQALEGSAQSKDEEATQRRLAAAEKSLQALDEVVRRARSLWADILQQRARALAAGAPTEAAPELARADNVLRAAAEKLEVGRQEAAGRQVGEARGLYDRANKVALGRTLLDPARALVARAERTHGRDFVPRSYARALDAVAGAEKLIEARGVADSVVQAAAAQAMAQAQHAMFLLERIDATCEGTSQDRFESTVLGWEETLREAMQRLGLQASFEKGFDAPLQALGAEADRLRADRDRLRASLTQTSGIADSTLQQVEDLHLELRERDAELAELRQFREQVQKIQRIQTLFTPEEGQVFLTDGDIILRLHGLLFASGKTDIPTEDASLLDKVVQVVKSLPGSRLIVEGHTDAQGRPEANLKLSEERAVAVRDYLVKSAGIDPALVTTIGYGASRPVASNDSDEGRARNRRIEIIVSRSN